MSSSEWRDIETAPKDGTRFDVWMSPTRFRPEGFRITDVYWSPVQDALCTDGEYGPQEPSPLSIVPRPTHWMPLPSPPVAS